MEQNISSEIVGVRLDGLGERQVEMIMKDDRQAFLSEVSWQILWVISVSSLFTLTAQSLRLDEENFIMGE